MTEDRRVSDTPWGDTSRILAILYIFGFLGMVAALFFVAIPPGNKDLILTIAGIMSSVQAAIIGYYFGSSKAAELGQKTIAASKERADTTLQELAKAPVLAAAAVASADMPVKADDVSIEAKGNVTVNGGKP